MRTVRHDEERTEPGGSRAGRMELRERRESWARSAVAVRKHHRLQMHARGADVRRAESENVEVSIQSRGPGADVPVAKIAGDRRSSEWLHLIARSERREGILKTLNIHGSIGGNFGSIACRKKRLARCCEGFGKRDWRHRAGERHRNAGPRGHRRLNVERNGARHKIVLPKIWKNRGDGATGVQRCAGRDGIVRRETRAESLFVQRINGLWIVKERNRRARSEERGLFARRVDRIQNRRAMPCFLDPAIQLVAQAVVECKFRRHLPSVLKIKVVRFAAHRGDIKFVTARRQAIERGNTERIGRRGEQTAERIRKWITRLNIVCSARGRNKHRRKRGTSPKRVRAVRIRAENGRVSVEPKLHAPLESVRSMNVRHVVLQLIDVAVRSENRSVRRIERLKKSVAKRERPIGVIRGGENRCTPNEAEGSRKAEIRRYRARIANRRAA